MPVATVATPSPAMPVMDKTITSELRRAAQDSRLHPRWMMSHAIRRDAGRRNMRAVAAESAAAASPSVSSDPVG